MLFICSRKKLCLHFHYNPVPLNPILKPQDDHQPPHQIHKEYEIIHQLQIKQTKFPNQRRNLPTTVMSTDPP